MCLTPIYIKGQQYDCGHCLECLKKQQQDFMVLNLEEATKWNTTHFITLTYNNDTVPISVATTYVDMVTGELVRPITIRSACDIAYKAHTKINMFLNGNKEKLIRSRCSSFKNSRLRTSEVVDANTMKYDTYFFSLRRDDVKKWIKRCRTKWFRMTGENLNFSYYGAGEYGSNTFRPHYHFLFYGLTNEQADFICKEWEDTKGFVCCKPLNRFNSDNLQAVSTYVSKYVVKPAESYFNDEGELPTERLEYNEVEKPRKQGSLNFGISENFEHIKKDLTLGFNQEEFSKEDIKTIIKNKPTYNYNGKSYRIPTKLKKKAFFRKDDTGRLHASPLRLAYVDAMADRHVSDYLRKFQEFVTSNHLQREDAATQVQTYHAYEKEDRKTKYYTLKDDILRKYSNTTKIW